MGILPGSGPVARPRYKALPRAILLLAVLLGGLAAAEDSALHILLTNDDGYDAPGIVAMHQALLGAGYTVSVVAPRDQQSGSSMRVSIGSIVVAKVSRDFWTVDGTPADAVSFALLELLRDNPPDLVISGANLGQNLGGNTNLSGTVGAAIMATQLGLPAIAVSVGIKLDERHANPRFPSTLDAFTRAAAFTVRLVHRIDTTRGGGGDLLPANKLLNVNYPALPAAEIKGARMARVARAGGFVARFIATDTVGKFRIALEHGDPVDDSVPDPDVALFSDGYITLSVLDGSLDADHHNNAELKDRLGEFLARGSPIPRP